MSNLIAGGVVLLVFAILGILLYRERAGNITLASDNRVLQSQKEASDRDVEKYRHETEIHSQPVRRGRALADAYRRLLDKAKRG